MSAEPRTLGHAPMIFAAMAAVLKECPAIGKNMRNQQQGFAFRGIDDVMDGLNPILARNGVFFVPDVEEVIQTERTTGRGGTMWTVHAKVRYRFYAADGSFVEGVMWGEGTDSGDKATSKAMTMAEKSMLVQAFAISIRELDPDATAEPMKPKRPAKPSRAPGVDALIEAMNAVPDAEARRALKRDFGAEFGSPDDLASERMEEAAAWVAARTASPASNVTTLPTAAAEPVEQTARKGYVEPKTGRIHVPKDGDAAPEDAATVDVKVAQGVHMNAKKYGVEEELLRDLISAITEGRTRSAKGLTNAEAGRVNIGLHKIGTGKAPVSYDENGVLQW